MKTIAELLKQNMTTATDELYVQLPAEITKVSNDGNYVSAILHINDEEPDIEVHHIRVRHLESQRAYIYLGAKKGDLGVVRFFDRSTEGYLKSDFDYNSDERQHDINDRCFELGFIPDNKSYAYPTNKEIQIGLKNQKFVLSVDENGNLVISSTSTITITAKIINTEGTLTHTGALNVVGAITATDEITANYDTNLPIQVTKHIHTDTTKPTGNAE